MGASLVLSIHRTTAHQVHTFNMVTFLINMTFEKMLLFCF